MELSDLIGPKEIGESLCVSRETARKQLLKGIFGTVHDSSFGSLRRRPRVTRLSFLHYKYLKKLPFTPDEKLFVTGNRLELEIMAE